MFSNERPSEYIDNIRLSTEFRYKDIVFRTMSLVSYIYKVALYAWIARTCQRLDQYVRGLPYDGVGPASGRRNTWRQA